MNKQIVLSLVAVMMSAGVGCATQSTEKSPEQVMEALRLEGATEVTQNASEAGNTICYRPRACKAGEVWVCCFVPGDEFDTCGSPQ